MTEDIRRRIESPEIRAEFPDREGGLPLHEVQDTLESLRAALAIHISLGLMVEHEGPVEGLQALIEGSMLTRHLHVRRISYHSPLEVVVDLGLMSTVLTSTAMLFMRTYSHYKSARVKASIDDAKRAAWDAVAAKVRVDSLSDPSEIELLRPEFLNALSVMERLNSLGITGTIED